MDGRGEGYPGCNRAEAARTPAIALLAPREVRKSEFRRTCIVREAKDPNTPEAMYRARKLPRPISSCTWLGR